MEDKHYAVLIDSDNVSARYITAILDEMTKYGTTIQQFCNTAGKNATDSALIIDAMDILYTGHVDGFCIVSSDSDFTKLASRLRESGMDVIGMGETKTPKSFKAACSVFTNLEILLEQEADKVDNISMKTIQEAIVEIITENENNGRKTGLAEVGNSLLKKYSDFDVRSYGYSSLSRFIEEMRDTFTLHKKDNAIYVKLEDVSLKREQLESYVREQVKNSNGEGVDLAALGQKLHKKYPDFKVKEYGYSTLQKFVSQMDGLELVTENGLQKTVVEREQKKAIEQSKKTILHGKKGRKSGM